MNYRLFLSCFIAFPLFGCVAVDTHALNQPLTAAVSCNNRAVEAIYDSTGRPVSFKEAVRRMSRADYVLAGEIHTNPAHHDVQSRLVAQLEHRTRFKAVLFEMLEPRHDPAVARFTAGKMSIQQLEAALQWTERGWQLWQSYASIFLAAKRSGLEIAHAGMDTELVRYVNQFGILALPRRIRETLGMAKDGQFIVDFERLKAEVSRHHSGNEASASRLAVSQYVKDAYMAQRLAAAGSPGILIAGNTHVRSDIGVPSHLRRYKPGARIVSVGMLEGKGRKGSNVQEALRQDGKKTYDFVWFTSSPCEESPAK